MIKHMTYNYPFYLLLKDIRKAKRVCCKCGEPISGPGRFMYMEIARGQYLCRKCETERTSQP